MIDLITIAMIIFCIAWVIPNKIKSLMFRTPQEEVEVNVVLETKKGTDLNYDIMCEILGRLPAKSLAKFRCVSYSWDSLITEDLYFASQYMNTPSCLKKNTPTTVSLACTSRYELDYKLLYTTEIDFPTSKYYMTNTCHGLVGVYDRAFFYLTNPSIFRVTKLPNCTPHGHFTDVKKPHAAIGFDSGEYKVVRIFTFHKKKAHVVKHGCEVLSLGKEKLYWRLVDDPPPTVSCKAYTLPFQVDGDIYWTLDGESPRTRFPMRTTPDIALSFNLRKEKFSMLMHPQGTSGCGTSVAFVLGGQVAVSDHVNDLHMIIWTLKDRERSVWVQVYDIDLTKMYYPRNRTPLLPVEVEEEDGRRILIIYHFVGGVREHYDLTTREFLKHDKTDDVDLQFLAPCNESILWPILGTY